MNLGIGGKTALVLGAGGGLGSAIAQSLALEGAGVVLADLSLESAQRTQKAIRGATTHTPPLLALKWDLQSAADIASNLQHIERELGGVDILINNTGGPPPAAAADVLPEQWMKQFNAMVLSVISITNAVLPHMKARRWGRIITSTSSGIVAPIPNLALSNALRSTLVGWSKTLAREVAADGITVNLMVPGRIATQRVEALDRAKADREGRTFDQVVCDSVGSIPVGRYGTPQEYGDAAAFLASRNASYITGSMLRIDGGLIASV